MKDSVVKIFTAKVGDFLEDDEAMFGQIAEYPRGWEGLSDEGDRQVLVAVSAQTSFYGDLIFTTVVFDIMHPQ